MAMPQTTFPFMQPPPAVQVLHLVRKTHDTTKLTADRFAEFCNAVRFYLRGFSVDRTAELVIEEFWTTHNL